MATNRQSGVAIAQRRDAGLMGLQNYVMQSDISDRILYEKFIDLVQYYYTKPQLFRITDEKNITRYFEINTNESNTIEVGEYDLIYTTQLKTNRQGRKICTLGRDYKDYFTDETRYCNKFIAYHAKRY